jgi:hypothetical protein
MRDDDEPRAAMGLEMPTMKATFKVLGVCVWLRCFLGRFF